MTIKLNWVGNKKKLEIAEHLRKLASGEVKPESNRFGICAEIGSDIVHCLVTEWAEFSGNTTYPIKSYCRTPYQAYTKYTNK